MGGEGGEGKGWRILGRSQGFQGKLRGEQPSQSLPMVGGGGNHKFRRILQSPMIGSGKFYRCRTKISPPPPHSPYDALTKVTMYNVSVGNQARCENFFCHPWILYNSRNIEVSAKKKVELRNTAHSFLYLLPGKD